MSRWFRVGNMPPDGARIRCQTQSFTDYSFLVWLEYLPVLRDFFSPSIFGYHHFGGEPENSYICNCLIFCVAYFSFTSPPSQVTLTKFLVIGLPPRYVIHVILVFDDAMASWNSKDMRFAHLFHSDRCWNSTRISSQTFFEENHWSPCNLEDGRLPVDVSRSPLCISHELWPFGRGTNNPGMGTYDHHVWLTTYFIMGHQAAQAASASADVSWQFPWSQVRWIWFFTSFDQGKFEGRHLQKGFCWMIHDRFFLVLLQ